MNKELAEFLKDAKPIEDHDFLNGKLCTIEEYEDLDDEIKQVLPKWVVIMLTSYPISSLIIRFKALSGKMLPIQFSGFGDISDHYFVENPGVYLRDFGYLCIADDPAGSGHPFFINVNHGDNPPVYQIKHSSLEDPDLILELNRNKVANSLSEIFANQETL